MIKLVFVIMERVFHRRILLFLNYKLRQEGSSKLIEGLLTLTQPVVFK